LKSEQLPEVDIILEKNTVIEPITIPEADIIFENNIEIEPIVIQETNNSTRNLLLIAGALFLI